MKKRTTQVAALPIRMADDGEMVSSRETRRWVIPKGWPSKKMSDAKAAAREAREEAGVTGKVWRKPVGFYRYRKMFPESSRILDVAVYVLWVRKQQKSWPEQNERTRVWTTLDSASPLNDLIRPKFLRQPRPFLTTADLSQKMISAASSMAESRTTGLMIPRRPKRNSASAIVRHRPPIASVAPSLPGKPQWKRRRIFSRTLTLRANVAGVP